MAGLVALGRPEAGRIGGEHFVAQHDIAVFVQTKFKLGVGNDDAALQSIVSALFIQGNGVVTQLGGIVGAVAGETLFQILYALLKADVFIVIANLGLGAGGVDGLGQLLAFQQALGQLNAAHLAGFLIAFPAAAGNVAAHDAFHGQHGELFALHAVALKAGLAEELGHIGGVYAFHVVGQHIAGQIEPEFAHLGQHSALFGHLIVQDHIKAADAVSGDHDHAVAALINFTNFSFFDRFQFLHLENTSVVPVKNSGGPALQ